MPVYICPEGHQIVILKAYLKEEKDEDDDDGEKRIYCPQCKTSYPVKVLKI